LGIFGIFWAFLGIFWHFWAFSGIFGHFLAFLGIFWHSWAFSGIFGHFLAFLALNTTFGIEDILFLPVSRPSSIAVPQQKNFIIDPRKSCPAKRLAPGEIYYFETCKFEAE
jgi:hypothetical protein